MSKRVYDSVLSNHTLLHTKIILRSYSGEKIPVLGKISVPVKYDNQQKVLDLRKEISLHCLGETG